MLLARGPAGPNEGELRMNGRVATSNAAQVVFFLVHYGIFWVVHGVFVWTLPTFAPLGGLVGGSQASRGPDLSAVAWGALGLATSHGASFVMNFLGRREYLRVSVGSQMFAPYGRLLILHMAIILGAFVSIMIGSPVGAVAVLVILKTIVDLSLHLRAHGVPAGPIAG
jgi:hypothetical protein